MILWNVEADGKIGLGFLFSFFFPSLRGKNLARVDCLLIPNRNLTFSFCFFTLSNPHTAQGGGGVCPSSRVTIIPPSNNKDMPEGSSGD